MKLFHELSPSWSHLQEKALRRLNPWLRGLCSLVALAPAFASASPVAPVRTKLLSVAQPSAEVGERQRVDAQLARLPLSFEQIGASDRAAAYYARGRGFGLTVAAGGWDLAFDAAPDSTHPSRRHTVSKSETTASQGGGRLSVTLEGAKKGSVGVGASPLKARLNRFRGARPEAWQTQLSLFERVSFASVYSGVDVVYYGNGSQLEYDFEVAPGADPRQIRMRITGAEAIKLADNGDMVLQTRGGEVRQHRPVAFQTVQGKRVEVEASYEISPDKQVSIALASYRRDLPLIIDPVLSYATYLGGAGVDRAWAVAVDALGNAYVAGDTRSPSITNRLGQPFPGYVGGNDIGGDAFVAKVNADGSGLAWLTYLGGSAADGAYALALDGSGNVLVAGHTGSPDFPTTNAFQPKISGTHEPRSSIYQPDAFVAKLSASGSQLLYSTFLGGSGDDEALGLAVDAAGFAYVTGQSSSTNFPTTVGGLANQGGDDAFVAKISPSGSTLVYAVTFGGQSVDSGEGIAVDALGRAIVTGLTSSTNFPLVKPLQSTNAGGYDAFVSRLTADGSGFDFSTLLGGTGSDYGIRIQLDTSGRPVVVGQTYSADLPVTNSVQSALGGGSDAFVARLTADLSAFDLVTYLGGDGMDAAWDVALDGMDNIYVAGLVNSTNFPTADALRSTLSGFEDAFLTVLAADGTNLIFSTYFGGEDNDEGYGLAVEPGGTAYLVGKTFSTTNVISGTNVLQSDFGGGGSDAFVARFTPVPKLQVHPLVGSVEIRWAATHPSYALEVRTGAVAGQPASVWTRWAGPVSQSQGQNIVVIPSVQGPRFYRLVRVP